MKLQHWTNTIYVCLNQPHQNPEYFQSLGEVYPINLQTSHMEANPSD